MHVCRQSEQQEALEEEVLEDSREEIIDGTRPPKKQSGNYIKWQCHCRLTVTPLDDHCCAWLPG